MNIGNRIKKLIESSSYSRTEIAEKINVSKQTLYKYENGIVTNIPSDKIEKMAELFNCSPGFIMGWEQDQIDKVENVQIDLFDIINEYEKMQKKYYDELINLNLSENQLKEVVSYAKYIKSKE